MGRDHLWEKDPIQGGIDWCLVLQTCFVLHAAQNITNESQWKATEDFNISDLIHFIQLKRLDIFNNKLCSSVLLLVDPTPLYSL